MRWDYLIEGPWLVFVAYWVAAALRTRKTVRRESFAARYGVMFLEVVGFYLLFSNDANIGVLRQHVVAPRNSLFIAGVVFTWIGIGIAVWARVHLGQYWSGRVTLKEGHQLIGTGPYAYFRHPIYSGLDLAAIGGALAVDRWRCVAGPCVVIVGFVIKARREESMLAAQFGEAFEGHRQRTGFLLPKF